MRVYYLNDGRSHERVFVGDLNSKPTVLAPAQGKLFEFEAPEDSIPFVKRWFTGVVLITFMDSTPTDEEQRQTA